LCPCGIKRKVSEFALHLRKTEAVALISYPKDAFHAPEALRVFINTDVAGK